MLVPGCDFDKKRSGNSAHARIFFSEPIPVAEARRLGALLITAMARCPDIGFDLYDRFFPSQGTSGFGNLTALPLQNRPRDARENGGQAKSRISEPRISRRI